MNLLAGALAVPGTPWGDLLVRRDHALVAGMPGCGKSPFAAGLVESARRVVYFDAAGDWSAEGERVEPDDLAERPGLLAGTFLRLVVAPGDDLGEAFRATERACRGAAVYGGLVFLVDEAGDLSPECTSELLGLHRNGHKQGVATVMCSPCMTDFPKRCRDTASQVFSFFQKNAADRAAMAAEYGADFAARAASWRHPQPPAAWRNPTLHGD